MALEKERKHYSEPITPGVAPGAVGLICGRCGCREFRVVYTRAAPKGRIRRRRECRHCGMRLTTIEVPQGEQSG